MLKSEGWFWFLWWWGRCEEDARRKCSLKCWKARIERSICSGFAHKCISSWASVDKTSQSYFSNNSLFRTFPVTDDDAYTRTCAPAANYSFIQKYKTVSILEGQYWKVPSTNYNFQMVFLSGHLLLRFANELFHTSSPTCSPSTLQAMHLVKKKKGRQRLDRFPASLKRQASRGNWLGRGRVRV